MSTLIGQYVTHLLAKHKLRLPTSFEEVMDNWLEILQEFRQPDDNMKV
jgi:hypothetical protein